nr:DUF3793 family protein [uncultured Merdimonas sp.]
MPVEVVAHMLSDQNISRRLQFQLILQCAPFLKGIKVACIMNLERRFLWELREILEGTGISYQVLAICKERCLIILFRRKEMEAYLQREEIREFLGEYGYVMQDLNGTFQRLAERIDRYSRQDICFPHEIGAFLDYPVEDVRGFIENDGQGCLMTGYWKVYHNRERAQLTFLAYDQARTSAVNEFLVGKSIRDIVYSVA